MNTELWPCHECGNPGIRNLGKEGYCGTHLAALYRTFDPAVFVNGGVGLPDGLQRPEYGAGVEDLRCIKCEATWCGVAGDHCWWCQRSLKIMREHQAELLLHAPDIDPDDITYESRMGAWADRLVVGVTAELITTEQAQAAWNGALRSRAA